MTPSIIPSLNLNSTSNSDDALYVSQNLFPIRREEQDGDKPILGSYDRACKNSDFPDFHRDYQSRMNSGALPAMVTSDVRNLRL